MSYKKTFFVVVSVDKPAGDTIGIIAADFPGIAVEHIHAVHPHLDVPIWRIQQANVGFAEDHEQIGFAGAF